MSVLGIDLGSLAATMCTVKQGAVDAIINEASKRKSPSLVSFHNGQRYLGEPAASLTSSNYKNTISEIRRLVGRQWNDPEAQRDIARLANSKQFKALPNGSIGVEVDHGDQTLLLDGTSVLAMSLAGLKRTAERTLSESGKAVVLKDCVLSVPPYFTDAQRRCVLDAGKVAGFNVLRLLNSTSAVALDYGMWKNAKNMFETDKRTLVLFVDVGYSDSHVSLASYTKGKVHILSTASDRELGGRDVDAALVEKFASEFEQKTKLNPRNDPKAMIKLGTAAEKAKQTLTPEGVTKAEVYVEYLMNETDLRTMLNLEDLEKILEPLTARLAPLINRVLEEARVQKAELHSVEMVGGSSRIRAFKRAVGTCLGLDTSKPPNFGVLTTLNADESVGRGCALSCALLSPQFKIATTFDVTEQVNLPIRLEWEQAAGAAATNAKENHVDDMEEDGGAAAAAPTSTNLTIFSRADEPKTRRVTFRRNEKFEIRAKYEDPLPEHLVSKAVNRSILNISVTGMPANAASRGKIAVEFTLSKSGVFQAVGASFVETVEEPAAEKDQPPKKKTTRTTLEISQSGHGGATEQELQAMMTREATLQARDKELRDRADMRNALEEFLYKARDALDGELKEFCKPDESDKLKKQIDQEEAWLYEDGENAGTAQFETKLKGLRSSYDKILDRQLQVAARAQAGERFSAQIQGFLQIVNSTSLDYSHLSDEERMTVRSACEDGLNWYNLQMAKQASTPLNVDPIFTSSMIDDKALSIKNTCRPITTKPKPAPPKTTPPPASDTPVPPTSTPPPAANGNSNHHRVDNDNEEKKQKLTVDPPGENGKAPEGGKKENDDGMDLD